MSITIAAPASNLDCGGAQMRARCHHLATVVTIRGRIDSTNIDRVSTYSRRFILAASPLVLDLSDVNSFSAEAVSLLDILTKDCRAAGLEWTVVPSPAVMEELSSSAGESEYPIVDSVREAFHNLSDAIAARRRLVLPLIKKTA